MLVTDLYRQQLQIFFIGATLFMMLFINTVLMKQAVTSNKTIMGMVALKMITLEQKHKMAVELVTPILQHQMMALFLECKCMYVIVVTAI